VADVADVGVGGAELKGRQRIERVVVIAGNRMDV
jgi:hypothetical protein